MCESGIEGHASTVCYETTQQMGGVFASRGVCL